MGRAAPVADAIGVGGEHAEHGGSMRAVRRFGSNLLPEGRPMTRDEIPAEVRRLQDEGRETVERRVQYIVAHYEYAVTLTDADRGVPIEYAQAALDHARRAARALTGELHECEACFCEFVVLAKPFPDVVEAAGVVVCPYCMNELEARIQKERDADG
jgi:hypothetical protein